MTLRICLVGDISGNIDEGMKKVSYSIYQELLETSDVIVLKPMELLTKKDVLNSYSPDIIHYLTGPSLFSFILLKIAKIGLKNTKTVVTISHPKYLIPKFLISLLKTDLALVQAEDMEFFFKSLGYKTAYIPNGTDIEKFRPINSEEKVKLRNEYNIDQNAFVVLHVGNIREGRNLKSLLQLAEYPGIIVILVASTTIKKEKLLYNQICNSKIILIDWFVKKVEDIYNMSDLYIFTVAKRPFAIDVPLSVLEAMACNLPVITHKFGGLPFFFKEGQGLYFINESMEILPKGLELQKDFIKKNMLISTREKIAIYPWKIICNQLVQEYRDLTQKRNK